MLIQLVIKQIPNILSCVFNFVYLSVVIDQIHYLWRFPEKNDFPKLFLLTVFIFLNTFLFE